jgi:hypothetical protein
MATYVIDIDGTICTNGSCSSCKYEGSKPYLDRIEKINQLYDQGHIIKYFTARGMGRYNDDKSMAEAKWRDLTELQLNVWGCKYHKLILGKPSGDYYIDDKAIESDEFFN